MDSHKFHMLRSNDGKNQEIWIKQEEWMHPKTIISEGSEMPFAVLRLLRKWSSEVNQIRTEFQSRARVGYAYVDFVYDNIMYKLEPGAVAATKDMFHHIAEMIQKDLNGSMQMMPTEAFSALCVIPKTVRAICSL